MKGSKVLLSFVLIIAAMSIDLTAATYLWEWTDDELLSGWLGNCFNPQIAFDASGNAIVVFEKLVHNESWIFASHWRMRERNIPW